MLPFSKQVYLRTFSTFTLLALLGGWIVAVDTYNHINTQKQTTLQLAGTHSSILSQRLNAAISLTYTLDVVLKENQFLIDPKNFKTLATHLMKAQPAVSSLQYAPDGIVTYVVPLKGNETIIGHNLFEDPKRSKEALDSVKKKRLTVAGPFELIQGGVALVARLPIFRTTGKDQDFWGFSTVLIRVSELLEGSGFNNLGSQGYDWNLWRVHPDTGEPHIFSGTSDSTLEAPAQITIKVPNATWFLNIEPRQGWLSGHYGRMSLQIAALLIIAGIGARLVYVLQRQPILLQQDVELRTKELQDANLSLQISEERFHKMFQEHNAVMLLIDPDSGEVVDANEAAAEYYGYTIEQLISRPMDSINTLSKHETKEAMEKTRSGEKSYFEFKHRLASGDIRNVEVYSSPIIIDHKSLLFSIIHDITERKQAEDELGKYRDQLEVLVEEQTQQLQNAQAELLQRERLATLGEVTATVSHELRNPLGTIQSALFSIENGIRQNLPQQVDRPLELAERSINRCVNIIEEINSYARVKELCISEALVDDWLQSVLRELDISESIDCELDLACEVSANFDQEKIRQVIVNLTTNAVQALEEKASDTKQLHISTQLLDNDFVIRFSDNGVGMAEDVKERMFEPLYSTKGFGVGLGMTIVKNIIERHHGRITVESQEGKGTSVSIRLPLGPPTTKTVASST